MPTETARQSAAMRSFEFQCHADMASPFRFTNLARAVGRKYDRITSYLLAVPDGKPPGREAPYPIWQASSPPPTFPGTALIPEDAGEDRIDVLQMIIEVEQHLELFARQGLRHLFVGREQ